MRIKLVFRTLATIPSFAIARVKYTRPHANGSNAQFEQLRAAGRLLMLDPVSPALLRRIRESAGNSLRMAVELCEILFDQGLIV
jgi:hypothetical protein